MKRAFIEIDDIDEGRLKTLANLFDIKDDDWKFDFKIDQAGYNGQKVWEAIKLSDEIYVDTALIPSMGITSGSVFNNMMHKTIEAGLKGKKVFIFRGYNQINWGELRSKLVSEAFKENQLFVQKEVQETHIREGYTSPIMVYAWEQVDIQKLIEEEL